MLPRYTYKITYPAGLVTSEEYSAPVQPNSELYVSELTDWVTEWVTEVKKHGNSLQGDIIFLRPIPEY